MKFNWSSFETLVKTLAPMLAAALIPGGAVWGPVIADGIAVAEDVHGPGTGATKRADVLAAVTASATALNATKGVQIVDPTQLADQAGQVIDVTIGVVNEIKQARIAMEATATQAAPAPTQAPVPTPGA